MARKVGKGKISPGGRFRPGLWLAIAATALGGFGCGLVIGTQFPEAGQVHAVAVEPLPAPVAPARPSVSIPLPPAAPPPLPVVAPPPAVRPPWQAHAVPAPALRGRIPVVIVIDDMGVDQKRSVRTTGLPGPLTLSYLPYGRGLAEQAGAARSRGHELMLHLPMQAEGKGTDPGPGALLTSLDATEVRRRTQAALRSFSGFVGVNNHMGSRFTADAARMAVVMGEIRQAGVFWLDSRTTARTVGVDQAKSNGILALSRDVFLDDDPSLAAVRRQLAALEAVARRQGHGIAIGHPKDDTIAALTEWLPTLEAKGFVLVPITALLRTPDQVATRP